MPTRIRATDVSFATEEFRYRSPIKFGGVVLDRATILNVRVRIRSEDGREAVGRGSMPLGNVWAWPTQQLSYPDTLGTMLGLAVQIARLVVGHMEPGHPIDLAHDLEPRFFRAADELAAERELSEPIPKLATLVVASAFDAALHDGFGKLLGVNSYRTYGRDELPRDLDHYLGADFRGRHLSEFVRREPVPALPLYHLVGALDPLTPGDVTTPVGDGLPETLGAWIASDGLTHLKIKLNGDDLAWDVQRVFGVERVAAAMDVAHYSLDFNERCANVDYLLDFLGQLREQSPAAFKRVQYIEQPTHRDLKADRANDMHKASALKPVVIDESLLDLESLHQARDMGYTGAALKACKGHTQSLLLAAAAQQLGMFLCVQDMTCPGASLIHSAGLAAHIPGVAAIEANARQYMPAANTPWVERFPGVFRVTDGTLRMDEIDGPGLGTGGNPGPIDPDGIDR